MYAHIHLEQDSSEIVMDMQWYGTPFLKIKRAARESQCQLLSKSENRGEPNVISSKLLDMAKNWKSNLIPSDGKIPQGFRSLSVGVRRASTVLFPDAASVKDDFPNQATGRSWLDQPCLRVLGKNLAQFAPQNLT